MTDLAIGGDHEAAFEKYLKDGQESGSVDVDKIDFNVQVRLLSADRAHPSRPCRKGQPKALRGHALASSLGGGCLIFLCFLSCFVWMDRSVAIYL